MFSLLLFNLILFYPIIISCYVMLYCAMLYFVTDVMLRRYDKHFFPNLILWQAVIICEQVDPNHAQKYTNWLCCCHSNVLVYTFVGFSALLLSTDISIVTEGR